MTKKDRKDVQHLINVALFMPETIGAAARSISAVARASKDMNGIITLAAAVPAIVQHPDFIVR